MSRGACPSLPCHNSRFGGYTVGNTSTPPYNQGKHPNMDKTTALVGYLSLNNPVRQSCHLPFTFYWCHKSAYQVDTKCNRTMYIIPFHIRCLDLPQWKSRSWLSYSSFQSAGQFSFMHIYNNKIYIQISDIKHHVIKSIIHVSILQFIVEINLTLDKS